MKKIPTRTCMGCNEKKTKNELLRIVKNKEGKIVVDKTGKLEGRGAYVCNNEECLNKIIKTKRIEKIFDMKISDEIYGDLRGVVLDK